MVIMLCDRDHCLNFRYDPDRARFLDPPQVKRSDDDDKLKFCPSCVQEKQKQLVSVPLTLL